LDTVTAQDHNALVASSLVKMRGTNTGQPVTAPLQTLSAQGTHFAEVRAFLLKYYGNETEAHTLRDPMGTVTSRDRFGLVTVHGHRLRHRRHRHAHAAAARALHRAGLPGHLQDRGRDATGKPFTKSAQVRMCGNSVCPPVAAAIIRAQFVPVQAMRSALRERPGDTLALKSMRAAIKARRLVR
jgi:DNA (cytosine-5)-methyltransferase 1